MALRTVNKSEEVCALQTRKARYAHIRLGDKPSRDALVPTHMISIKYFGEGKVRNEKLTCAHDNMSAIEGGKIRIASFSFAFHFSLWAHAFRALVPITCDYVDQYSVRV